MTKVERESLSQGSELVKDVQTGALAFFRVELRGENIVSPDHRRERSRVVGLRGNHVRVSGNDVIGMDEIEGGIVLQILEDWSAAANVNLIPAHVRHFEPGHVR